MALRTTKSNLDNEEHEDLSFNYQQEDESDEEETEGEEKGDQSESDDDTIETVVQRCSVKKVFLEILQNSQENTCARVSFLLKLQASGLQLY